MKDLRLLNFFLGLDISYDQSGYYLSQAKYAADLVSRAGLIDSKTVHTHMESNAHFSATDGTFLSDGTLYRQLVGSLIYLTVTHRPNIAHVVHIVSQFMIAPRTTHSATILSILHYVRGAMFHGIHFSRYSSLDLRAYFDANWADDPTDRCSNTSYCFFLGDSLISWHSKKQTIVSHSRTEAKYRVFANTTSELL